MQLSVTGWLLFSVRRGMCARACARNWSRAWPTVGSQHCGPVLDVAHGFSSTEFSSQRLALPKHPFRPCAVIVCVVKRRCSQLLAVVSVGAPLMS